GSGVDVAGLTGNKLDEFAIESLFVLTMGSFKHRVHFLLRLVSPELGLVFGHDVRVEHLTDAFEDEGGIVESITRKALDDALLPVDPDKIEAVREEAAFGRGVFTLLLTNVETLHAAIKEVDHLNWFKGDVVSRHKFAPFFSY